MHLGKLLHLLRAQKSTLISTLLLELASDSTVPDAPALIALFASCNEAVLVVENAVCSFSTIEAFVQPPPSRATKIDCQLGSKLTHA